MVLAQPGGGSQKLTRLEKVFTFVGVLLGLFLSALDQTVVAAAAPDIARDFHIPPHLYAWLTTSYVLASTVLVPVWGKLSDLYGRRNIVVSGIGLFLTASVLCGLSQNTFQLIAARGLQGAGSAALMTTAFAVVADLFPPAERGKYSGVFGGVFALASLIGPVLGGVISQKFSWHWVFLINLPVGAVALFFILTRMPPLKRVLEVEPRVDFIGAGLLASSIVPILVALSFSRSVPGAEGSDTIHIATSVVFALWGWGLVSAFVFGWWERKVEQPLVNFQLFKNRVFRLGNATVFVIGGIFMSPITFLPLYLMRVQGATQSQAGLLMVPMVLGILVGNIASGQLVSRLGRYKGLMLSSLGLLMAALAVMGFSFHDDASRAEVIWKTALVGIGLGPSLPLYTIAIQNSTPPEAMGSATSMATFFRQMGGAVGVTLAGAVFAAVFVSPSRAPQHAIEARAVAAGVQLQKALRGSDEATRWLFEQKWIDEAGKAQLSNGGPIAVVQRTMPEGPARAQAEQTAMNQLGDILFRGIEQRKQWQLERVRYSEGIRSVYQLALGLAGLAFLLTLGMPSLPLRRRGEV